MLFSTRQTKSWTYHTTQRYYNSVLEISNGFENVGYKVYAEILLPRIKK